VGEPIPPEKVDADYVQEKVKELWTRHNAA
jgi:hypothetical protein